MPRLPFEEKIPASPLIPGDLPHEMVMLLRIHARDSAISNREMCGFICCDEGKWFIKEIKNASKSPSDSFKLDWEEQVEFVTRNLEVIAGIWHTHPSGDPNRSHTDKVGFSFSTGWRYWIATEKAIVEYVPSQDGTVNSVVRV